MNVNYSKDFQGAWLDLPHYAKSVVCIGCFDGVHIGHQALIQKARTYAHAFDLNVIALCFNPHPKEFLNQFKVNQLTTIAERFRLLKYYGVDHCVCLNFDQALATLSAESFLSKIVSDALNAQVIVVGDNFKCGHQQSGNIDFLKQWTYQQAIQLDVVSLMTLDQVVVSSTRCRASINDPVYLSQLLGRSHLTL